MNKKNLLYWLIILPFLSGIPFLYAKELPHLTYFYSEGCHACQKTRNEVIQKIEKELFDKLIIEYLDIADIKNYQLLLSLKEKYHCKDKGVPVAFIAGRVLVGYDQIKRELPSALTTALGGGSYDKLDRLAGIDLAKHFLSFGALTLVVAGLIDGINPCAFTVIVFFISFLTLQGYRKRELLAVSLAFIFAVFVTYILIGLGIFRVLYALRHFYFVTRAVYYAIGGFCFILGGFALYDLWLFKKTGKTEQMSLQLPQKVKNMIHDLIGRYYRKTKDETGGIREKGLPRLMASALAAGFLIAILEGICTGQMYLPTIAFVLKETSLRARAFLYLLLYNFMFIVPLLIIMACALFGATSQGFAKFVKGHMLTIKLSMAIIFFGLGVFILVGA